MPTEASTRYQQSWADELEAHERIARLEEGTKFGDEQRVLMMSDIRDIKSDVAALRDAFAAHVLNESAVKNDIQIIKETLTGMAPTLKVVNALSRESYARRVLLRAAGYIIVGFAGLWALVDHGVHIFDLFRSK